MKTENNDEFAALERELGQLRPRRPSEVLEGRIGKDLAGQGPRAASPRRRFFLYGVPLAAMAACLALLVLPRRQVLPVSTQTPALSNTAAVFTPLSAQSRLLRQDYGTPETINGAIARKVYLEFEDTLTWENPRSRSLVRWTVPREEVRVEALTAL